MKCLKCGHCCIAYDVLIIKDKDKGLTEDNIQYKPGGEICPHLEKTAKGYNCLIHHFPWYKQTPCYEFSQVESFNEDCRIGKYLIAKQYEDLAPPQVLGGSLA
jgi:hypothetical protein